MKNLVGKTLGKYRIVSRLGRGGMAEVYKAYQPGLDRYVAIKVMHEHLSADEALVKRFRREALATARLSHPNIVQVLDFDQAAGLSFMVMQFIDGPTLEDEIKARRGLGRHLSLEEVARIYQALGSAIDYAHNHNMVHRDLKPANIMINEEGQALLTDFGIARMVEGTQHTATGALMGTPAYMSPEQGKGAKVDGRSDIYAFGVILYELVAGKVPFEAPTPVGVLMKHILEPLPPPSAINPQLPQAVEQVIVKATKKAPHERYQSAGEMAQALSQAVGLAPDDTLRHRPLKTMAKPPKIEQELDPHQGRFTPVGVPLPSPPPRPKTGPLPPTPPPPPTPVPASRQSSLLLLLGGIGLVVALLVIGASFFLWSRLSPVPTPTAVAAIVPTETPQPAATQPDTAATATATWPDGDDDQDGLANADEVAAGTLPDNPDSDQDELDDLDEIDQFKTDPLEADTDGDNLADGVEVGQGLNPLAGDTDGDGIVDATDPDPSNLPTPTPTSPSATDTPTPEPTATAVPTEEPTVTPTSGAANVVSTSAGPAAPGVFQDFESQSTWRRGDEANGTFERTTTQVHSGGYAGQLDYSFPSANNDYVVFLQNRPLAGRPTALTAWVYGDGAGHFLNAWIKDSGGQVWGMSFGQISHTGWQQMTAPLDPNQPWPSGPISGVDNGAIDYPISFQALTLDDGNDGFSGQGTIYIDDLSSQEGASVSAATPTPAVAAAPTVPVAKTPSGANPDFEFKIGQKFSYVQPWGAPRNGDVCQTLKNQDWDDTQSGYRSLSVELSLTNNSASPIPDDWGGVVYITGKGEQGLFCRYEYPGSGPPPGETRAVTFFAVIPRSDYIQYIRFQPPEGSQLELCLNSDGSICP